MNEVVGSRRRVRPSVGYFAWRAGCSAISNRQLLEHRALLEAAGFCDVQGRVTGAPLDAVLAIKP